MYKKEDLIKNLQEMGLTGKEAIMIHSSMKSIGEVEGGADTVVDALMEFFAEGLLRTPTHTWAQMSAEYATFDPATEPACVGIIPNIFRKREGVLRSLHPTHSIAIYGKGAAKFIAGEENATSPCPPGFCWDRLKDIGAKILLLGVTHTRNTFIHSVEEVLNIPNRLADKPMELYINMPDGSRQMVYMRKHYNAQQPHISEDFVKMNQVYLDCGVVRQVRFGDAQCLLCDAQGIFEVTRHVLAPDPECLVTADVLLPKRWEKMVKKGV